jgi:uncharacterized protein YicC (UPF0701 family)
VLAWELKSVNHRFLEVQFRMPEQLRTWSTRCGSCCAAPASRQGRLHPARRLPAASAGTAGAEPALLLQILATLEQVRRDAPEVGAPNVMDMLRWPGMLGGEVALDAASSPSR